MLEKSCRWWPIWYLLFFCHGAEGQLQWVVKEKMTAYGQNLILFCPVENCCSEPAGWFVGPKTIILDIKTFSNDPKVKYHGTYNKDGFGVVIRNLSEADLNVTYRCIYGFNLSTPKYLLHGDVFRENNNECLDNNGGCSQYCRNLDGSYECYCQDGLVLSSDNTTCFDKNECLDNNGGCSQYCRNLDGSYECYCQDGLVLSSDNTMCLDVPDKDKEIDTAAIYKIVVPIVLAILVAFIIGMACVYRSRIKKKRQKQTGTDEEMENLCQMKNQPGTDEEKEDLRNSDIEMKNQQGSWFHCGIVYGTATRWNDALYIITNLVRSLRSAIDAQQSSQGELVSGTLGVGYKRLPPTTSQQAQSAKMKSQKPNYENEGDAWTIIPRESDESGKGKGRENFFRINVLVVDHIKNVLVHMFKYYLHKKKMSFEEFIDEHMADIEYLRKTRNLFKEEVDKLIVGDKAISDITEDGLEVTLVRRLLENLCPDLFMDDDCKTLQDFLKKNQHDIYHLFKFNELCCQCSQDYIFPITSQLLQEDQYKKMFKLSPCANCTGASGMVCSVSSCIVTEYIRLDYKTKCQIFGHFSPIFKAMQKFTLLRNIAYGHANAAVIPNELYDVYKHDIEENIMVLARICGNEDETRLALDDVQKRLCDETLCTQYQNRFMMKGTEELKEKLKTTETNLTKDLKNVPLLDYGGVVTQRHLILDSEGQPGIRPATKRMAVATTSRYESNYIRIAMVVLQVSPRAVRVEFDKQFDPKYLQTTLNSKQGLLSDLKKKKRITQPHWNLLFPMKGEQPSSKDFDITLMICLLRNLIPIDIDNRLPSATDTSLRADLSRIKYYRNLIVHCYSALVDDTDFESYWNDITPAILRLGGNSFKVECDDWCGRNLDAKQRDDGLKCINGETRLAIVEKELAEMNKKLIELEQEQSKKLAETKNKLIALEQEQSKQLAEMKNKLIELEQEQSKELPETKNKLIELKQEQSKELAETKKKLIELKQDESIELAETKKKLIELEQEQSKQLAETKNKLIALEQEQSKQLPETKNKFIALEQEQSKQLAEIKKKLIELKQDESIELAEAKKKLIELEQERIKKLAETKKKWKEFEQEQSKELAETNKKLIELEQEQRNPVPTNIREYFYKLDLKCDNIDIHCIVDRRLERTYASLNSVYKHEQYGQHLIDDDPVTMTVNQLNQTTQSEFEQLYIMKSTVSDRTQFNLRRALVDASRQQFSILFRWLMANIHNRGVTNKEMESALDIAFKNLDKDTAKAISWCITKTFYKTFQVNLRHCFDVYPGLRFQCLNKGQNTNALCSNDKLIIITSTTEVKGLPAEYKGFKIKIMDVHDKSTQKSESETLSALLSQNYTDSYHIKGNISNSTAKKLFDSRP